VSRIWEAPFKRWWRKRPFNFGRFVALAKLASRILFGAVPRAVHWPDPCSGCAQIVHLAIDDLMLDLALRASCCAPMKDLNLLVMVCLERAEYIHLLVPALCPTEERGVRYRVRRDWVGAGRSF
jgi:hypothetical protein